MSTQQYPYTTAGNYTYDSAKIEVTGGVARLKDLGGGTYDTGKPTIQSSSILDPFGVKTWDGFTETLGGGNQGSVEYQLSKDQGNTWYYYDGSRWIATTTLSNPVATVNSNIDTFDAVPTDILYRALLISNGSQEVEIDLNEIVYTLLNSFPSNIDPDYDFQEGVSYPGVVVVPYPNGMEQRISTVSTPRRDFTLKFKVLTSSDMDTLWNFFIQQQSSVIPFIFTNIRDSQQYIVRFATSRMDRTLFAYQLESTGLKLIEVIGEG